MPIAPRPRLAWILAACLLLLAACAPSAGSDDRAVRSPETTTSVLVGLPPLGTPAAEVDTADLEVLVEGPRVIYVNGLGGYRIGVCTSSDAVSLVGMSRRFSDANRFRTFEGVTFNASLSRVEALLIAMRLASAVRTVETADGATAVEADYLDGRTFRFIFEGALMERVTLSEPCPAAD